MEQGVSSAAEEYGVQCTVTGAVTEQDIDGQIALVEEAIARRPNAIILAASDPERLSQYVKRLWSWEPADHRGQRRPL